MREPGEALLTDILTHLPLGVWVARAPSGEAIYANDAFAEILGMAPVADIGIEEIGRASCRERV